MAKFIFQLEAVLHHRRHEEHEKQRLLADQQAEMVRLDAQLRALDGSLQANLDDLRNNRLTGTLDMRYLAANRRFMLAIRQEAMGIIQAMARQQTKLEEARAALAEAAKQRKIMEKLRERAHERWKTDEQRKEMNQQDEAATQHSYRAMMAAAAEEQNA